MYGDLQSEHIYETSTQILKREYYLGPKTPHQILF